MRDGAGEGESGERSWRALALRAAVGLIVSVGLVGGVVWVAGPDRLWSTWSRADLGWLGTALLMYGGVLVARWIRLMGLVERDVVGRRTELLWATAGHSFAMQLLPARSGELVFPELWRRATGESYTGGFVFLTAIRAVELAVVSILFAFGFAMWLAGGSGGSASGWWPWAIAGGGVAVFVALPRFLEWGVRGVEWVLEETRLVEIEALDPMRAAVPSAREALDRLGGREWIWITASSVAVWAMLFGVYVAALRACGLDLGLAQTVVGAGGGVLGNLVPLGAIGSMGTMEAGWTAAFRATGAPVGPVAAAGFAVHGVVVVGAGVTTLLAWLASGLKSLVRPSVEPGTQMD